MTYIILAIISIALVAIFYPTKCKYCGGELESYGYAHLWCVRCGKKDI